MHLPLLFDKLTWKHEDYGLQGPYQNKAWEG